MRLPPLGHGEGAHCWPHSLLPPGLNHHGGTRTPRGRGTSPRLLDDDPKKETPPSGSQTAGHTAWELLRRTPRNQGGEWEGKIAHVRRARPRPRDTARGQGAKPSAGLCSFSQVRLWVRCSRWDQLRQKPWRQYQCAYTTATPPNFWCARGQRAKKAVFLRFLCS